MQSEQSCLPPKVKEADLYLPIKRFLEAQHYEVKGEIHGCDVFAIRGSEDPVVVELKLALNLNVVLQAVDRLAVTPKVYVGVPNDAERCTPEGGKSSSCSGCWVWVCWQSAKDARGRAWSVLLDPGEFRPRKSKRRQERLAGRVRAPGGGSQSRRNQGRHHDGLPADRRRHCPVPREERADQSLAGCPGCRRAKRESYPVSRRVRLVREALTGRVRSLSPRCQRDCFVGAAGD